MKISKFKTPSFQTSEVRLQMKIEDGQEVTVLSIPKFNKRVAKDVKQLLLVLKEAKIDRLVLDLRDNPGGDLDAMWQIAGFFLSKKAVAYNVYLPLEGNRLQPVLLEEASPTTNRQEVIYEGNLSVLVNRNTANAAETFIGALKNNNRGLIVGGSTYSCWQINV